MTCKWLIAMVFCCPPSRLSLVANGLVYPLLTNHLLSGVILQVLYSNSNQRVLSLDLRNQIYVYIPSHYAGCSSVGVSTMWL